MERQVGQMVRLVDDLLDVSRISRGRIELRPERVDMAWLLRQVEQTARPLVESMGQALTTVLPPQPVVLNADPVRLVQVIGNLVNNASKFTERGGHIGIAVEVEVEVDGSAGPLARSGASMQPAQAGAAMTNGFETGARLPGAHVTIRVRDDGIGIAASELPRIFQMFTQIDASLGRSAGGLGIGLALVKDLVELHGGTVAARSDGLGHGSEFEVRLPIAIDAPAPAGANPTGNVPAVAGGLRILVVDDNRDAAESLAEILKLEGHDTRLAYDGLAAVTAAAQWQPDVVLLDIGLPTIDGYETARRLRAQNGAKPLRIIALTGWGQTEARERTAQAGFDAHVVKPVVLDELSQLLR